jgi:CNT family concentrative nucleoside transporter
VDEKNAALPVEQYAVDSEKQSERVGSLQTRSDPKRGLLHSLWHRHWKKAAQLVTFMVFTASVIPPPGARSVSLACGKPD